MREVTPGDVVFSFADTLIKAIGIAVSHAYEAPKPLEFGQAGAYWDMIGWRVDVRFVQLRHSIRPSEYMSTLAPFLPRRYSPLLPNGNGLQSVYLTHLPETFAAALVDLIGVEAREIVIGRRMAEEAPLHAEVGLGIWEEHEMEQLRADTHVTETMRQAVVQARRGQGLFKERV
ncbi:MAG: HNH endonuclease, partial [Acidobacteriota bacterium]|nr:HNH endonuclease [Acidobacteriota bacterium]